MFQSLNITWNAPMYMQRYLIPPGMTILQVPLGNVNKAFFSVKFTGKLSNPPLSRCYNLSLRLRDRSFIKNQLLMILWKIYDCLAWMEIDCVTRLCRVPSSPISSSESIDLINLYFQLNNLKIFIDKKMICYPWYFNYLIPSHRHVAEIGLEAEKCIPQWIMFLQVWVIC